MLRLVISDLDGTFLNSEGTFDKQYFKDISAKMKDEQIFFAACTGKQCERVEELFGKEFQKNIWILGDSATRIKYNGAYIYESLLPNKVGISIINRLEELSNNHVVIACTDSAAYINEKSSKENESIVRGSYKVVKKIESLESIKDDFVKITVYDPSLSCFETVQELKDFKNKAYIVASEKAWIDISNYNVHKGTTVRVLQKILNISKSETIAFGDGYNDLELFEEVGISFAMENAFPKVKENSDFVTKSNNDNGVLKAIKKIIELESTGEIL